MKALDSWITGSSGKTANTRTRGLSSKSDVTLLSPRISPRVLHKPVIFSTISSISNSGDSVVEQTSWARSVVAVDTSGVLHDGQSEDGDGDWSSGNGLLQLAFVLLDVGEAGNASHLHLLLVNAVAVDGSVRVLALDGGAILHPVLESVVHESSVATLVAEWSRTVDQLLLRERFQIVVLQEVSSFQTDDSGESPTGPASALILDRSNGSFGDPVDFISHFSFQMSVVSGSSDRHLVEPEVLGRELFLGHIGELVQTESETGFSLVDRFDLEVVVLEHFESVLLLLWRPVESEVLALPALELLPDGGIVGQVSLVLDAIEDPD